ncbi:MAG: conjugative transposon protein TraM, partial [Prevotella sp.]|nr:conjugative transposon protein TraM [Prevotella sp.]
IGSKYESMLKSYGKIDDYSAVDNIDRNNEEEKEEYNSRYSEEERASLESEEAKKLAEMQEQLQKSAQKGKDLNNGTPMTEDERVALSQQREKDAMEELNKALAQARLQGQAATSPTPQTQGEQAQQSQQTQQVQQPSSGKVEGKVEINERSVKAIDEDEEAQEVVKKVKVTSDYFNTLCENEPEKKLIKAIIDENVKAVDGSRVRLRLLDDIEINETVVPKGSYIYAIMSGFGSQRVKGSVKSILVDDELIKVSLSIYDTDGLEGLYVPGSAFRETSKDVASGAMSGNMNMGTTSSNNSLSQWGMQALTNAYQKTSNAIGKAIKKNSAKLKYGTFVYLVNGKEKKNN